MVSGGGEPPGGWFNYEGWSMDGGDGRAAQFASAHESHHKQLADSTTWGALTRVLLRLPDRSVAARFNHAAAGTQEAFATWGPVASLGWSKAELAVAYPDYVRHWEAMNRAVSAAPTPYLALHAAHAVARSCLQGPVIDPVLDAGLAECSLADVPRRLQPDHRFAVLQRNPVDWAAVLTEVDATVDDPRWPALREARALAAELFAPALQPLWSTVNEIAYAACAARLAQHGCPTLAHEGHRAQIARLLGAARSMGVALDLSAEALPAASGTLVALANAELETYVTGALVPARLLPTGVPPEAMITGPVTEHLMLSIRRGSAIAGAFDFGLGPAPDGLGPAVQLRRGEDHGGGLRMSLRPAEDVSAADLRSIGVPVYTMIDLSLFSDQARQRWGDLLSAERAVLVLDVSLAAHLPIWLADEHSTFRYAFLRTEVQGRVVGFLLADFAADGVASHLLVRGLSHAAVGVHRAAFEELAASGTAIVADDTVAQRHEPLLGIAVAHLAIEERVFGIGVDA